MPFGLPELATALRQYLAAQGAARTPIRVKIYTVEDREPFAVNLPAMLPSIVENDVFVPNAVQQAILDALEGKAMKTSGLVNVIGSQSQLFRKPKGGIQELIDEGRVAHHARLGYYRPDAPPEELATPEPSPARRTP